MSSKRFIQTHPEYHPFIQFLIGYRNEWTTYDLMRDYPRYYDENISRAILKLRHGEVIIKTGWIHVYGTKHNLSVWKLNGDVPKILECEYAREES